MRSGKRSRAGAGETKTAEAGGVVLVSVYTTMKEIKHKFFGDLAGKLKPEGFVHRKSLQGYKKTEGDISYVFHISIINHENDFDITADTGIRFDEIEERRANKRSDCTIGVELGNWKFGRPLRWTIKSEADISSVSASIYEHFINDAKDFFARLGNVSNLQKVLKEDRAKARLLCPVPGDREWLSSLIETFSQKL